MNRSPYGAIHNGSVCNYKISKDAQKIGRVNFVKRVIIIRYVGN